MQVSYRTVGDLLRWTQEHFQGRGHSTPKLDAEILLAESMGIARIDLYTSFTAPVSEEEKARFRELIKRRSSGEPVAYILGSREFYSLSFDVSPAVLIPRPETEHLVETVIELACPAVPTAAFASAPAEQNFAEVGFAEPEMSEAGSEVSEAGSEVSEAGPDLEVSETGIPSPASEADLQSETSESNTAPTEAEPAEAALAETSTEDDSPELRVLDLGTGSGCIAITLATHLTKARIDAVDVQSEALQLARANAEKHEVSDRIRFIESDLFANLERGADYDYIVSNPPYISASEHGELMRDVRDFEPASALIDTKSPDHDGLGFYRAIANDAPQYLSENGSLVFEVGESQSTAVRDILSRAGFTSVRIQRDLADIERVLIASR